MLRISFASIPLLLLVVGASIANGQPAPNTPPNPAQNRDPSAILDRLKTLTGQLNLTADQKTQIDAIFKNADIDLHSAAEDLQNASAEDKTTRYGQLLGDLRQQIGELLTDDQKAELQQKLQALRKATSSPANNTNLPDQPAQNPAGARQRPGGAGPNGGPPGRPGRGVQMLQRLKNGLDQVGLSADQQTQVDQLLQDIRQQLQTIRAGLQNGATDRDAVRGKVVSLFQSSRSKLIAILTPEQQAKLLQLLPQNPAVTDNTSLGSGGLGNGSGKPPLRKPPAPQDEPAAPDQPPAAAVQSPGTGQQAPDFALKTLNGEKVDLSSYNHKLLVLVLGSYTNPSLRDRAAGLESLRDHYSGRGVNFLFIYTRETHPTGGWEVQRNKTDNIDIAQPKTQSERNSIAQSAKAAMNLSIAMAPDTMDDKTATAFAVADGVPAYVISRDGKILFHQSWLEPMTLEGAIVDALK